jgi:hypothetical protein
MPQFQVTVPDALADAIDSYCLLNGYSHSAGIRHLIAQAIKVPVPLSKRAPPSEGADFDVWTGSENQLRYWRRRMGYAKDWQHADPNWAGPAIWPPVPHTLGPKKFNPITGEDE